jgi:hypothetical protein
MKDINQLTFQFIDTKSFIPGCIDNIKSMLPRLFPSQIEDVAAAENRFMNGKGFLFTNGTGTGKTFVGLGICKRFYENSQSNILIVVPTDKKCIDWIDEGKTLGLKISKLQSTNDQGEGISVTTYANFYQNNSLRRRNFNLIIYDESHYLNQNEKGTQTTYMEMHRILSNLPSAAKTKIRNLDYVWDENGELKEDLFNKMVIELINYTKVVFLSATPFSYHKSIKYADGCLFDIYETLEEDNKCYSYNEPSGFEKFICENFGYRMRYNRCTVPESGVDVNLLERSFFEKFKEKGVMSTRQIDLDYDYSREFITIDSSIGNLIDSGLELFWNEDFKKQFPIICEYKSRKYNHNYVTQLLESIKAKDIHFRIKQHLDLGRKVVVFHNYNNALLSHPFQFVSKEFLKDEEFHFERELIDEIKKFKLKYKKYWDLDLSDLLNTRESITRHFKTAREFNGTINKKNRDKFIREFNTDDSDVNVLVIQIKAGKEGISLHDKTGRHQRVLINLGLPTSPTDAIQTEGRIYREGLKSNSIYEYTTLQTNTERLAFATKIAERSKTAENLAMGNLARDLETAFKEGYISSSYTEPNLEQGTGGKEADKFLYTISEFDKSKTFYYQRLKKTSKNKSKEGSDYFATPEPLGLKMIQWLNTEPDQRGLEPSAGHGAIARFFPGNTTNHFVEPSHYLSSELAINSTGVVHIESFEDYYVGNKFDFIAMNPPFGSSGKTAMEHIEKACKHLNWFGGTIMAIVPNGGAMNKRLDNFFTSPDNFRYKITGEILLPTCTFERAGTTVSCKIVRIQDGYHHGNYSPYTIKDLSNIKTTEEFFSQIEHLEF